MSAFGLFLRRTTDGYAHHCPACDEMHHIAVDKPLPNGAQWSFNGDRIAPTFHPSVNISTPEDKDEGIAATRCHYFVLMGSIQYCSDCTHACAGKTVPMTCL